MNNRTNKNRWLVISISLVFLCFLSCTANAQATIESTFDTGLDGWTGSGMLSFTWQTTGGNPDGYVQAVDSAGPSWAHAPAKFLGDLSTYIGGRLSFDLLAISGPVSPPGYSGWVVITGPTLEAWGSIVETALTIGEWKRGSRAMTAKAWELSEDEWSELLSNVTSIKVVMDTSTYAASEVSGMDNFSLEPGIPGDADCNGCVNLVDFSVLAHHWGDGPEPPAQ